MNSVKSSLKKQINGDLNAKLNDKMLDTKLANLIKKNNISKEDAMRNLSSLEDSLEELDHCAHCSSLLTCKNRLKGHVFYPTMEESHLAFRYIPCKKMQKQSLELQQKDANYELEHARMKDIDIKDKKRLDVIKWLKDFYDNYDILKTNKGLYLHGSFGSGKSFLIAALLNELREKKDVKYEMVYFPELLRSLKDNFNLLDSKVRYLSNIEILVIDDIGAEKVSDWGRDEILGTILQARMNNRLTTFFTSNLTIEELEKHLACTKDSEDVLKAGRIIERIKQLTDDLELISKNRRS